MLPNPLVPLVPLARRRREQNGHGRGGDQARRFTHPMKRSDHLLDPYEERRSRNSAAFCRVLALRQAGCIGRRRAKVSMSMLPSPAWSAAISGCRLHTYGQGTVALGCVAFHPFPIPADAASPPT
ncbi:hypothetical protein DCS_01414 [Drechmeria coniospora]|uniref:Uncharacterized protein n=1 Tax=Drechmeria coniospora TaxID=98403 RepID=A0A151GT48_DRECN|nr:hypothetical protein DCS_01414 [Drechmeria coniospora]KYK60277.1 hypothetical protein DCS_01414 [Drechmeria coniospora]